MPNGECRVLVSIMFSSLLQRFRYPYTITPNYVGRHSYHGAIGRHVLHHNGIGTHLRITTYGYFPKDLGTGMYLDVVTDRWAIGRVGVANCDVLVDPAILANAFGGYYCAETMLNEETWTNIPSPDIQGVHGPVGQLCELHNKFVDDLPILSYPIIEHVAKFLESPK